jgi:hypothetical protein
MYLNKKGVEDDIRTDVWKFILGIYPWDSSLIERESILEAKRYVPIIILFF